MQVELDAELVDNYCGCGQPLAVYMEAMAKAACQDCSPGAEMQLPTWKSILKKIVKGLMAGMVFAAVFSGGKIAA